MKPRVLLAGTAGTRLGNAAEALPESPRSAKQQLDEPGKETIIEATVPSQLAVDLHSSNLATVYSCRLPPVTFATCHYSNHKLTITFAG